MSTNLAVIRTALTSLALATGGGSAYTWYQAQPVRYRDYWNVPERQPIPAPMREAGRYTAAMDEQRAACEAEMAALSALIDKEQPGEFDLAKEIVTADAMKAFVEKLLRLGEATVACLVRMEPPARKFDSLIAAAPAHYRESAAEMRRYVEETAREDIKQNYMMLADICEAKAVAAERHRDDVREYLNSDLLDYMREMNVFLERMLGVLNNGLAPDDLQEAARFRDMLKELVTKHEYLSNTLRIWRARVRGEAPPAAPEPPKSEDTSGSKTVACETRSERESGGELPAAAPLPRVMQVATLKLFGGVLHELRERTRWLSTSSGGALREVPETEQAVGLKLCATRAELPAQSPRPEPERPDPKPAAPEPPKPEPVRVQPAERQALAAPQPKPPRTGRDTGWGDYSAQAKEDQEHYNYFREHGCFPPVTSAVPQAWTGAASAAGPAPARWSPAAEIERDKSLAARGDAGALYRLRSRAMRGY